MHDINGDANAGRRRHVWPWFVLAAFVLGVILAVLWMSAAVRRLREYRDSTTSPNATETIAPNRATNPPSSTNAR